MLTETIAVFGPEKIYAAPKYQYLLNDWKNLPDNVYLYPAYCCPEISRTRPFQRIKVTKTSLEPQPTKADFNQKPPFISLNNPWFWVVSGGIILSVIGITISICYYFFKKQPTNQQK